ncbi:kinase-like domain-containing protein [Gigaspora rosea]|uniref:Kinase-like domain-containing protein n=1 Tax=Gigaspora rosea TaxID=44941 RepID=A0A397VDB7_9GLOM|nr:kinase-like domain-containing protein [Gigaspora rosea]
MNKILRLFRKKKNDENEYPNRKMQFETGERETLEQDYTESYKNFKSPDLRRFSHPTPLGRRNLNQLPKIITDPTQLAIIGDYNRRNNNAFNNNNRHSSYNRNDFDFEKLIEIRKAIKTPGICPKCYNPIAEFGYYIKWCLPCQSKFFRDKFNSWSSGYNDLDVFIQETQLTSQSRFDFLEWIPYNKFKNIKKVGSSESESVYRAMWLDGPYEKWDVNMTQYLRCGKWRVALKSFGNSVNISKDFFINLRKYLNSEINNGLYISRYYGITRDPSTKNYMMVVQYACDGDLRKYYEQNSTSLTWQKRLNILHGITAALTRIHKNDLVHPNLHSGSVLIHSSMMVLLSDLGFYKPQNNINEGLYCNLPFTAPETLQNILVTKESNIYSFGLIMWELAYCKKPFSDRAHDLSFAIDICNGVHPEFNCDIPECYVDIMEQCLSLDPFMRPTAEQLYKTLGEWLCLLLNVSNSDIAEQFHEANERLPLFDKTFEDHPEAIYNSRFYNFKGFEPSSEPSFQQSL